ncbi:MAG: hypothetical protein ABGY96_27705 [bacterium]|nr:hypothetical protein [Gammaproteobacteria bacterium]HIL98741.1 hypothetical protein [Pseudomonadales bacterium]
MQSISFNQPGLAMLLALVVPLFLLFPIFQMTRRSKQPSALEQVYSWLPGFVNTIIIVFVCATETFLLILNYSSFWTISVDHGQIELEYWFPRADKRLEPSNVSEVL